jgi:rhodanese-related sulfurtransferase
MLTRSYAGSNITVSCRLGERADLLKLEVAMTGTKWLAVAGLVPAMFVAMTLSAPAARAQDDPAFTDPALAAARPAQHVTPAEVLKLLQDKDTTIALVDTQPVDGYVEAHLPGATNYPWAMRITHFPISLPRNKTLIFYGSCPNDTEDTVKKLAEFGYENVKIMDGGLYKWQELKFPVEGKPENPAVQPEVSQLTNPPNKGGSAVAHAK